MCTVSLSSRILPHGRKYGSTSTHVGNRNEDNSNSFSEIRWKALEANSDQPDSWDFALVLEKSLNAGEHFSPPSISPQDRLFAKPVHSCIETSIFFLFKLDVCTIVKFGLFPYLETSFPFHLIESDKTSRICDDSNNSILVIYFANSIIFRFALRGVTC